jgi:hypothetical protein
MPSAAAGAARDPSPLAVLAAERQAPILHAGQSLSEVGLGCSKCVSGWRKTPGLASAGLRAGLFHSGGEGEELVHLRNFQRSQQPFSGAYEDQLAAGVLP